MKHNTQRKWANWFKTDHLLLNVICVYSAIIITSSHSIFPQIPNNPSGNRLPALNPLTKHFSPSWSPLPSHSHMDGSQTSALCSAERWRPPPLHPEEPPPSSSAHTGALYPFVLLYVSWMIRIPQHIVFAYVLSLIHSIKGNCEIRECVHGAPCHLLKTKSGLGTIQAFTEYMLIKCGISAVYILLLKCLFPVIIDGVCVRFLTLISNIKGLLGGEVVKNPPANAGDAKEI